MGRNEEGRKEERRRREQFVKEPKISFLLRRNAGLSEKKPLCTASLSDTVAVGLQSTAILHISNTHVVCGPSRHANIILSLSLSLSFSLLYPSRNSN